MKTRTLSIRVEEQMIEELDEFEQLTHIERASLIRAATRAALDRFKERGTIVLPIRIVDSSPDPKSSMIAGEPE